MAKNLTEYKGYPLTINTDSEKNISQMLDISIHKSCCQIPFVVYAKRKIDYKLFLQALNEEIKRNDTLRMRWIKIGFLVNTERYHYFLKEYVLESIPELDFRGKDMKELEDALNADAAKALDYLKGETFRFKLLHAPDGRDGFYFISSHLSMDICAMLTTVRDLLLVYNALENGTEMPAPLYPYEEMYKQDQKKFLDDELQEKYLQYYRDYQARFPYVSFYAGFDRMRQLNANRKKKKDPNFRYVSYSLLNNKTEAEMKFYTIKKDMVERIEEFCSREGVSFQAMLTMALRTHLSRWNERTEDVSFTLLSNRRATLKEQRTGGCRVGAILFRSVISNDLTFRAGLKEMNLLISRTIKRSDLGYFKLCRFLQENENRDLMSANSSCFISCLPPDAFPPLPGWELEFRPAKLKHFPFIPYFLIQPMGDSGDMSLAVIYQIHKFTEEDIELAYQDTMKVIEMGMSDPDMPLNVIIDSL